MNIRAAGRVSTNDGYLEPARDRPNLAIRGGSQVDTLVFEPASLRVAGVRLADGERCMVHPGGEVILCGGAVHPPATLMRSGLGPAAARAPLRIPVVLALPPAAC